MSVTADRRGPWAGLEIASRAAVLAIAANGALMVLKITVGLVFGSVALLGDGVDSAQDLIASGLAFFSIRLALQPADATHPYGHGKAESLAAMSQAALIAGGAVFISVTAIRRMVADDTDIIVAPSLVAICITAVVNLGVVSYSLHAARVSGSVAIAADARHLLTNVVQAGAVGLGLVLVWATGDHIYDPIVALLLAAYLLWIALGILRSALSELIDTSLPPETVAMIEGCLQHEGHGMRGYHALRTRKSGREIYIDVHALVDPAVTVSEAHRLIESLESHLMEGIPGAVVSVHVDPDEPGIMERHAHGEPAKREAGLGLHRH